MVTLPVEVLGTAEATQTLATAFCGTASTSADALTLGAYAG